MNEFFIIIKFNAVTEYGFLRVYRQRYKGVVKMDIILASGSPRRREILEKQGVKFRIVTSDKEEKMSGDDPEGTVRALTEMKALDVYERTAQDEKGDFLIIGADTVVACDGKILGKPGNAENACRMLEMLSGREHYVYTGVCLTGRKDGKDFKTVFAEKTAVFVSSLTEEEIAAYAATGEPLDKAGAYAIQGLFAPYVERIEGDYYNIVGFPLSRVFRELKKYKINLA